VLVGVEVGVVDVLVGVGVDVLVGVEVDVLVGVPVREAVLVREGVLGTIVSRGVLVGVIVGVIVGVFVGVLVVVPVGVVVNVLVEVLVGTNVAVDVGVLVGTSVLVEVLVGIGVAVDVGVSVGTSVAVDVGVLVGSSGTANAIASRPLRLVLRTRISPVVRSIRKRDPTCALLPYSTPLGLNASAETEPENEAPWRVATTVVSPVAGSTVRSGPVVPPPAKYRVPSCAKLRPLPDVLRPELPTCVAAPVCTLIVNRLSGKVAQPYRFPLESNVRSAIVPPTPNDPTTWA